MLENKALRFAGKQPELRHELRTVPGETLIPAALGKAAQNAVKVALYYAAASG